ncbi:putative Carbon catabolite-derepressing protein kinase [Blattamonas nauphoetae]|uniref:Carbon catabolite-derepressing protein kinase n=1 Tax=Blattamonas nauphoetae TaxID=2049346 RepID=A0ABQ9XB34_9EUKA|nr:putative Carbon catabolite-derepressing protein kinase [Blattamonas nauphoetae]
MADRIKVPDGYSCVRIISSGGFGTVVELIENATTTHYAGKMVQCLTDKDIERFDREVGRMRRFNHARIIKLKEVVTMDNTKVMVMELGGKSLAEIMKDLTERKVLMAREDVYRVMEDIAPALELMHNHADGKTAHGDVKMENILIDADGHAKLCDFGAAESEDVSSTRSSMTQMYVSPERMDSETGRATCEADVWSLGVVLFWLLFGEPPFKGKTTSQMIRQIASFKVTDIPISCGELERALLMRMMDTCAESRVTCRQLRLSKSFRCIVNTVEGIWKLNEEEQNRRVEAEEAKKKAEEAKIADVRNDQLLVQKQNAGNDLTELNEVRKEKVRTERENIQLIRNLEELRLQLASLPIWVGTESLQTLDKTAHTLTPTTLTQIIVPPKDKPFRTAFTRPIDEGEWELRIRASENNFLNVMLGFVRHPLPEYATQKQCGSWTTGIGGHFNLWNGRMWRSNEEFKPAGTNKTCDEIVQTAAIRVNMRTREARLIIDDEEQPGIFTDIPSPLCLGITTHRRNQSIDLLWLKRLRGNDELERSEKARRVLVDDQNSQKSPNVELPQQLADLPIWIGTESLQTFDRTVHRLKPTTLTQVFVTPTNYPLRPAFTRPIDEGEWELKIRASNIKFFTLGFLQHPLPEDASQRNCGAWKNGIGGDFFLWNGEMWKGGEFKPEGTNKMWKRIGQTAAIRVNMWTREARLFVDDEEQPGIFTDIPSPLCLGISTGFPIAHQSVEVMWLKRRRNDELERVALEERRTQKSPNDELKLQLTDLPIWVGTASLQTLDRTAHTLTPTTLTQIINLENKSDWRTAFTRPIDEGEWEIKIRIVNDDIVNVRPGFVKYPLPDNATQELCGFGQNESGGCFSLRTGKMLKNGAYKPEGTNKTCDRIGQTAAIRVNMRTREARLVVDEEEQPGIFTDIPSPLCLALSTHDQNDPVEVMWLKRLRGNDELERAALERRRTEKLKYDEQKVHLADLPIWAGTESLQTFDRTVHRLKPTTLIQTVKRSYGESGRSAFTFPIGEGEWELKIRSSENTLGDLGFLKHPLPKDATQSSVENWKSGGGFQLYDGSMYQSKKPIEDSNTNKKCVQVGQTAAIRVNMWRREARLVVDDEEQPVIFTDIPSPLCLGINTEFRTANLSVEVLWLKQRRS